MSIMKNILFFGFLCLGLDCVDNQLFSAQNAVKDEVARENRSIANTWALKRLLAQTPGQNLYKSPLLGVIAVENGTIAQWYGRFHDEPSKDNNNKLLREFDSETALEKITRNFFTFRDDKAQCIALPSSPAIALESKMIAKWISFISEKNIQKFVDLFKTTESLNSQEGEITEPFIKEWQESYFKRPEGKKTKVGRLFRDWLEKFCDLLSALIKEQTQQKAQQQFITLLMAYLYLKDVKEGSVNKDYSIDSYFKQLGVSDYVSVFYTEQDKEAIGRLFQQQQLGASVTSLEDAVFYMISVVKSSFAFLNQPFANSNLIGYPSGSRIGVGLCGEVTLRSMCNCILYDFSRNVFDLSTLPENIRGTLNQKFVEFYKKNNNPFVKDYYGTTLCGWLDLLYELGGFPRTASRAGLVPTIDNFLAVFNQLFGVSVDSLEDLGNKLSTPTHIVNFNILKNSQSSGIFALEIVDKKTNTSLKAFISFSPMHADFTFESDFPAFFLKDAVVKQLFGLQETYGVILTPIIFNEQTAGIGTGVGKFALQQAGPLALKEFLKTGVSPELAAGLVEGKSDGRTTLCDAASKGDLDRIAILLEYGAKNTPANDGSTPLAYAVGNGHVDAVKMMQQAGFEASSLDKAALEALLSCDESKDDQSLINAVRNRDYGMLQQLLASPATQFSLKDEKGNTALHYAAIQGDEKALSMLLECPYMAETVEEKNQEGKTPVLVLLSDYLQEWNIERVKVLLKSFIAYQANFTVQDSQGNGVLHYACKYNDAEMVKDLLEAGAKRVINAINQDGETALEITEELENILLEYGADPRIKMSGKRVSLFQATRDIKRKEKFEQAIKKLEEQGIPDPMAKS